MSSLNYDFDLFVIGGGSGGVRSARWAASMGKKVAICEADLFGGTCVLRGCIPKKMMVYGSKITNEVHTAKEFGWDIQINSHNWNEFRLKREKELLRLSSLYQGMLDKNDVSLIKGKGCLKDPNTVEVNGSLYSAKNIIIAVGGIPWKPQFKGSENTINSNDFFNLKDRPKSVVINGGGFIAVEFACLLRNFSSEVHVVIRREEILRGFDKDCAHFLQSQMNLKGIKFHVKDEIKEISLEDNKKKVTLSSDKSLIVDEVISATGRIPNSKDLNLDSVGIKTDKKGAIIVDQYSQTSLSNIYAVGDVTNRVNLTPVALREGMLVIENLYHNKNLPMTYKNIPSAVFSDPPLATVGETEEQLQDSGISYEIYKSEFRPLKYTLGEGQQRTFMKMLVDKNNQKVLGLHMVGDDAPEIIQGFAVALKAGVTKSVFDATIGIHPTSAEEFVTMR